MKDWEAASAGFNYTGMSASEWDSNKWNKYKSEAQKIKQTYKGADFRVVNEKCSGRLGTVTYKSIYGNEIFCKVQHFNQEVEENYLNNHNQRLVNLQKEYELKVQEETDEYEKRKANYISILKLKK